ncbi:hypothetical protein [Ursidibacter arcticus]
MNGNEKSPELAGLSWKQLIARYVAFQAVRYLHRTLFVNAPMPEAFGVLPVVKSEIPFSSPAYCRETDNKTRLILLSRR